MAAGGREHVRFGVRYWIPVLGYVQAATHNPPSLNFLENTVLYFVLGFVIRHFTPILIPVSFVVFAVSAVVEWVVFSRLRPRSFGWDRLDRQSFVWCVWQAYCFLLLGMLA